MSAVAIAKDISHQGGIGIDQLTSAKERLLPLNEESEKQRAAQVSNNFGAVSPGRCKTPRICSSAIFGFVLPLRHVTAAWCKSAR
jgi:hypothetical protein